MGTAREGASADKAYAGQPPASLAKHTKERQQAKIAELRQALIEYDAALSWSKRGLLVCLAALLGRH